MQNKIVHILFLIIVFAIPMSGALRLTEDDLNELDATLKHASWYEQLKFDKIDSVRIRYNRSPDYQSRFSNALKLGDLYSSFKADSAYQYYGTALYLAQAEGNLHDMLRAEIDGIKALGVLGMYNEAIDDIRRLENTDLPENLEIEFYDAARQLYYYLMGYASDNIEYSNMYFEANRRYRDLLLSKLSTDNEIYTIYYAEKLQDNGNIKLAREVLQRLITNIRPNTPEYARAMSHLANLSEIIGNTDQAAHYMALSAIADIKNATKENISLQNLAKYLYSKGDIVRAYNYLDASLNDANFCNARLRNMQIARDMPIINQSYQDKIRSQKSQITKLLIVLLSLLIIILIIGVLLAIQYRKVKVVNHHLLQSNSVKEEYIGHFLELVSIYMERLDSFTKTVRRKISTGQSEELLTMTKSPKFTEEQNKLFYENFDIAFIHIYPTFVAEFNALLRDDERIDVPDRNTLTMELRIFAFFRLGINDANKIASFLRYSVNTVYTYRNKIKNKAKNRDTFDADLMQIGIAKEAKGSKNN